MRTEFRQAARHRLVIAENAVAVQFDPIGEAACDVIQRKRTLDVARELDPLPGGEVLVNLAPGLADFVFHRLDFRIEIEPVLVGMILQVLEPALQLEDRLFEIQWLGIHFS